MTWFCNPEAGWPQVREMMWKKILVRELSQLSGKNYQIRGRFSFVSFCFFFVSMQHRCICTSFHEKFCPSVKCYKWNKFGNLANNCQEQVQNTESNSDQSNQKPKSRACVSSSKAMMSSGSKGGFCEFLVDSAATDHICNERSMFSDLRACCGEITMGKGSVAVLGEGKIELQISDECGEWNLQVSHVLYAPDYNFNLLSTSKLAKKEIFCTSECD